MPGFAFATSLAMVLSGVATSTAVADELQSTQITDWEAEEVIPGPYSDPRGLVVALPDEISASLTNPIASPTTFTVRVDPLGGQEVLHEVEVPAFSYRSQLSLATPGADTTGTRVRLYAATPSSDDVALLEDFTVAPDLKYAGEQEGVAVPVASSISTVVQGSQARTTFSYRSLDNGSWWAYPRAISWILLEDNESPPRTFDSRYQYLHLGDSLSGDASIEFDLSGAPKTLWVMGLGGYDCDCSGIKVPLFSQRFSEADLLQEFATAPSPSITGPASVGSTLTANPGTWSPSSATFTYQWNRNGSPISGAVSASYKLMADDAGTSITVSVTGSLPGHVSTSRTSAPIVIPRIFSVAPTPTISGTLKVGSTLTAAAGTWTPAPSTLTYQWRRNGVAISGATARTYKLVTADAATTVTVTVTAKRSGYTTASRTSATKKIAGFSFTAAPTPTISGTARVGYTLTATAGTWSPRPASLAYQWKRNGLAIPGATGAQYKLVRADAGTSITVTTTAKKTGYNATSRTSSSKRVATLPFTAAPAPSIQGTIRVGSTLTAAPGAWSPTPTTFSYRWFRNGVAITGATAPTYKLTASDAGRSIAVKVTARRSGYTTTTRVSAAKLVPLSFSSAPAPTITGTASVGYVLTANLGIWSPSPATLTYQWRRDGAAISTATGKTYRLTATDAGTAITVTVTAKRTGYATTTRTSAARNISPA
jgi:hypothetical protein